MSTPTSAAGSKRCPGSGHSAPLPAAAGRRSAARAPTRMRGFTLMEILIVMAIVAIGASMVTLAWPDNRQRALLREGDRLAALLETARMNSRASGQPIRWRITENGFAFEGAAPRLIRNLPTHWETPGVVALMNQPALVLGPEPILPPQSVVLSLPGRSDLHVRVASNGVGPFVVQTP